METNENNILTNIIVYNYNDYIIDNTIVYNYNDYLIDNTYTLTFEYIEILPFNIKGKEVLLKDSENYKNLLPFIPLIDCFGYQYWKSFKKQGIFSKIEETDKEFVNSVDRILKLKFIEENE